MPIRRTRRVVGAVIALSVLGLSVTTAAPKAKAAVSYTAEFRTNLGSLFLEANGYGLQTDLWSWEQQPNAIWTVTLLSGVDSRGGYWAQISDDKFGYCLDAQANATGSPNNNGDHVNSWPCDGLPQQRWYFWPIDHANFMIVNGANTNKVLDATTNAITNPSVLGDPIELWDHDDCQCQAWVQYRN